MFHSRMRLSHVMVAVSDLDRSVEFYRRLGLRQIVGRTPDYARFELPEGGATFSVHVVAGDAQPPGSLTEIGFECDDLDERVAALKQAGIEFAHDPVDQPYLWREARIHDPDGNVILLFEAGENRLNPPWRLPDAGA
jgi:catechol 2,3-dioxygenase-like lactoylglutathione lyase family enzyme